MNILLMHPTPLYSKWPPEFTAKYVSDFPSVTLPQLAAALGGHKVGILDGFVENIGIKEFRKKIVSSDIIAFNARSSMGSLNTELNVGLVKRVNPDVKVVLGGHHATFFDREWVGRGVDFVVRGEGELTLPELVRTVEKGGDLSGVRGITYRDGGGRVRVNPDRPFIEDLDSLPLPSWDLMNLKKYRLYYGGNGFSAGLETSRGCVHSCSFCLASAMWKRTQRFKSPERVIEELKLLKDLGVDKFYAVDENFGIDVKRDRKIYNSMDDESLDFRWGCFIRADTVVNHPDMVRMAAGAGLRVASVGFESPVQDDIERFNKDGRGRLTVGSYKSAYRILNENDILVIGLFIVGSSYDDPVKAKATLGLIYHMKEPFFDVFCSNILSPMPGTAVYDEIRKSGLLSKDMFYHDHQFSGVVGLEDLVGIRNLLYARKEIRQAFYLFSRREIKRNFIKRRFALILEGLLTLTKDNLMDSINFYLRGHRHLTEQERLELILNKYLNEEYINKLLNASQN